MSIRRVLLAFGLVALLVMACAAALVFAPYPLPGQSQVAAEEREVRRQLGDYLDSVTVTPMRFTGVRDDGGKSIVGFQTTYVLKRSGAIVSNYSMEGARMRGMLPEGEFRTMPVERFVDVVDAWAGMFDAPLGTLDYYDSDGTTETVDGTDYASDDLWVAGAGFTSLSELRRDQYDMTGYLIYVPDSGPVMFIGKAPYGVLRTDIGD